MATQDQLTYVSPGILEWREVDLPGVVSSQAATVRPLAVARCDLDFAIVKGMAPLPGPFALGHETYGEVVDVGDGVTTVAPGDRVVVPFQISCGTCDRCMRGLTGSCTEVPKLAAYGLAPLSGREFGGGLSDLLHVPFADSMLVSVPDGIEGVDVAAAGDNLVDAYRTVAGPMVERPGSEVLIIGGDAASIGLYAVAIARALGSPRVVYYDGDETRLSVASRLGAESVKGDLDSTRRIGRFPVVVNATSREEGLKLAILSTDIEGILTSVGIYFNDPTMPLLQMYTRGIDFRTSRVNARRHLPEVLMLMSTGRLDISGLEPNVVNWEAAPAAYETRAPKLVVTRPL